MYDTKYYYICVITLLLYLYISCILSKYSFKENLENEYNEKNRNLDSQKINLEQEYKNKTKLLELKSSNKIRIAENEAKEKIKVAEAARFNAENKVEIMDSILKDSYPFKHCAELYEDFELILYKQIEGALKKKVRPAITASESVKELRKKTKGYISAYKEMLWKYEYLLNVFPELRNYVDDEQDLRFLEHCENVEDFNEHRDNAKDFLNEIEWKKLSVDERNQLALDRYKNKNKSKETIGLEYEMYIDFLLRKKVIVQFL